MNILEIHDENPVVLQGYLDGAGALQFQHTSGSLADHSQTLYAVHETSASITVELHDFSGWRIDAIHGRQRWTRGTDHAWYTFTEDMTDPVEVTVTATSSAPATPTTKRKIYLKTAPKGSLPAP